MNNNIYKQYEGKTCKVILQGPLYYSGKIIEVNDNYIIILDYKTNKEFTLSINAVISIGEQQ